MKRVVRDCLSGTRRTGGEDDGKGGSVDCEYEFDLKEVVGVEGLEWFCENIDGAGWTDESMD